MLRSVATNTLLFTVCFIPLGSDAREWVDASGKYRFEAELINTSSDAVRLRLSENGEEYDIPLKMLSEVDRQFVKANERSASNQRVVAVPSSVSKLIRENAQRAWPDDYSMQRYVIKQQEGAYIAVARLTNPAVPPAIFAELKRKAQTDWNNDFTMQKYTLEKQCKAYVAVQQFTAPGIPRNVIDKILSKAKRDWPGDYSMQSYVIEKQVKAYEDLAR